jgi:hypothetical protein
MHIACLFSLTLFHSSAKAVPLIETLQRLDFGIVAVKTNTVPTAITLSPQGTSAYGSGFVFIGAARPGRYRLTGYPAFTDISVSMTAHPVSLSGGAPSETLTVSTASSRPLTLHTDQNGQVDFDLGATLTTSGSGIAYVDGTYQSRPTLTLSFLVANQPQLSYQDIDIDLELRTSLALTQIEQLNFGRLAVFSSATDQARMTLSPNGSITIINPAAAKIIRYGGEVPGTFRISTGAAHAPVTITLPSGTVYLTHQSESAQVARLLVTNFVSQPAPGSATLNAQGQLDFRMGATVSTEQTVNRYQDGEYSGTFLLDVEY